MDQHIGLVSGVTGSGGCRELEPVIAQDDVLAASWLGVGDDAIGAPVSDVGTVQLHSAAGAAAELASGLVKHTRYCALCAA